MVQGGCDFVAGIHLSRTRMSGSLESVWCDDCVQTGPQCVSSQSLCGGMYVYTDWTSVYTVIPKSVWCDDCVHRLDLSVYCHPKVCEMECMCALTGPQCILSSQRGFNLFPSPH